VNQYSGVGHSAELGPGLTLHPEAPSTINEAPRCSWVRSGAVPKDSNWHHTTGPLQPDKDGHPSLPQWATQLQEKLDLLVPADARIDQDRTASDAGSESEEGSDDGKDADDDPTAEDQDMPDLPAESKPGAAAPKRISMVHPTRFRIYGMAASPGRGATVILASESSTHKLERWTYSQFKTTLYVAFRPQGTIAAEPEQLTTEGKMFEWMYGGGPGVPGITEPKVSNEELLDGESIRQIFDAMPGIRDCDVCDVPLAVADGAREGRCPRGHVFGTPQTDPVLKDAMVLTV
jgi:hypothetical protein